MRGDFELALIRYAPDAVLTAEVRTGTSLDFEPSYRGVDGVRAFVRSYQDAFRDHLYEPKWLVDLGDNLLVMLLQHRVRGRASGIEVEQVSAHRLQTRNGWWCARRSTQLPGTTGSRSCGRSAWTRQSWLNGAPERTHRCLDST
jgi:hypothetical protein